jgi:pimeloyl-ACP methyl ester carboxylesterase
MEQDRITTPALAIRRLKSSAAMTIHRTDFGVVETADFPGGDGASLVVLLHATATGPGSLARLGKMLAAAGHHVVIPALHRYGETWVNGEENPVERSGRVARWALNAFPAERRALFGQSMGGLAAVLAALSATPPIDHLILYEPMVMRALNPRDPGDTREREWDRALVRAVCDAVATDGYEASTAAFIEAWNETAWADMPAGVREAILRDGEGLAAELRAVNDTAAAPGSLERFTLPTLLLGGDGSPPLAGRILDRLQRRLPNTERVTFEGLGHMGPVMAPSVVAEKLLVFLG